MICINIRSKITELEREKHAKHMYFRDYRIDNTIDAIEFDNMEQ